MCAHKPSSDDYCTLDNYFSKDRVADAKADAKLEVALWPLELFAAAIAAPMAPDACCARPLDPRVEMWSMMTAHGIPQLLAVRRPQETKRHIRSGRGRTI